VGVRFSYLSPDGEEGYPGNLQVTVTYLITDQNEMKIDFTATTDKPTPVNLTNHNYWNLAGQGSILDHVLQLECDEYLPVDDGLIPTGEIRPVEGTPLDFRKPMEIGSRIESLKPMVGYDHCLVVRPRNGLKLAARVKFPQNGRVMEVWTTQPAIQFYSGNFLDGSESAGGFKQYEGFCLETQHYPDSPNKPEFPSTILHPGETFRQGTIHKFLTE
jgi:aldose 1-epimerase